MKTDLVVSAASSEVRRSPSTPHLLQIAVEGSRPDRDLLRCVGVIQADVDKEGNLLCRSCSVS